jgi:hypothetical protein
MKKLMNKGESFYEFNAGRIIRKTVAHKKQDDLIYYDQLTDAEVSLLARYAEFLQSFIEGAYEPSL